MFPMISMKGITLYINNQDGTFREEIKDWTSALERFPPWESILPTSTTMVISDIFITDMLARTGPKGKVGHGIWRDTISFEIKQKQGFLSAVHPKHLAVEQRKWFVLRSGLLQWS